MGTMSRRSFVEVLFELSKTKGSNVWGRTKRWEVETRQNRPMNLLYCHADVGLTAGSEYMPYTPLVVGSNPSSNSCVLGRCSSVVEQRKTSGHHFVDPFFEIVLTA